MNQMYRSGSGPPRGFNKRRKVGLACTTCRDRKTRCDGIRPACLSCQRRGVAATCLYEEGSKRAQRFVLALEDRIRHLENANQQSASQYSVRTDKATPDLTTATIQAAVRGSEGTQQREPEPEKSAEHPMREPSYDSQSPVSTPTPRSNSFSAGDALATTSPLGGDLDSLYGSSSTIAFVRNVFRSSKTAKTGPNHNVQRSPKRMQPFNEGTAKANHLLPPGLDVIPRRRVADEYLRMYWEIIQPVWPVLHKPSFEEFYDKIWSSDSSDGRSPASSNDTVLLAILNIVFAFGCQFTHTVPHSQKSTLGQEFYERAVKLVPTDTLDSTTIHTVQLLLLTAIYLQGTGYSNRCWNTAGLAVRGAQSLGLHLEHYSSGPPKHIATETRRRIWYVCVTVDSLMSMTYGRPGMISSRSRVPRPEMLDDEYINETGAGVQPQDIPSRMGMFLYTLDLLEVLNEVLQTFYAQDDSPSNGRPHDQDLRRLRLHEVIRLNAKLDAVFDTVPGHLKINPEELRAPYPSSSVRLQAKLLTSRFLYIRLLLLRPVVLSLAHQNLGDRMNGPTQYPRSELTESIAKQMYELSLQTAHNLLKVVHDDLEGVYRSSAWYSIYFTFGAAIVLITSQLSSLFDQGAHKTLFDSSWELAMTILLHYKAQVQSASHAVQVLKAFAQHVVLIKQEGTVTQIQSTSDEPQMLPLMISEDVPQISADELRMFADIDHDQYMAFDPDPLTEEWFSQQVLNLDSQDLW